MGYVTFYILFLLIVCLVATNFPYFENRDPMLAFYELIMMSMSWAISFNQPKLSAYV
jgi:hypothetical protein